MLQELCWINGRITPLAEASVSIEDRGYQFADGVYEVIRFYAGRPFELAAHLDRLERSCAGIDMSLPLTRDALAREITNFATTTNLTDATTYLQVTRGTAPRNHLYVGLDLAANLLFYPRPIAPTKPADESPGVRLLSVPDERWRRCWIKALVLLPNVLAKNAAARAGADEAVFVDEHGVVSECSTSNLFAVVAGRIVTHPAGPNVLPGITRLVVLRCAADLGIAVDERPMSQGEAIAADELFITSTTREVAWVENWNKRRVGSGRSGPVTARLHHAFRRWTARGELPSYGGHEEKSKMQPQISQITQMGKERRFPSA
jgi:D-alanine transaminase